MRTGSSFSTKLEIVFESPYSALKLLMLIILLPTFYSVEEFLQFTFLTLFIVFLSRTGEFSFRHRNRFTVSSDSV